MSQIATVLLFLFSIGSISARYEDVFKTYCTLQDGVRKDEFKLLTSPDSRMTERWNAFSAFKYGTRLGKGSFGEVRKASISFASVPSKSCALKKMKPADSFEANMIRDEIKVLDELKRSSYFPKVFGCVYNVIDEVLVAQSLLSHNLESTTFRKAIQAWTCAKSIKFYNQIIQGMLEMWEAGYAHCDFKPENVMTDTENKKPTIIDVGLAQLNSGKNTFRGSPYFMAPSKYTGGDPLRPKDDLYSVAISIVLIEAPRGYDELFYYKGIKMNDSCFKKLNTRSCRERLMENAVAILSKAGYGPLQDFTKVNSDTINFTTLIAKMIDFDSFSYDYAKVIKILQRLINDDNAKTQLKVDQQVAEQQRLEAAKLAEARRKIEEIDERERAMQADIRNKRQQVYEIKKKAVGLQSTIREKPEEKYIKEEADLQNEIAQITKHIKDTKNDAVLLEKEKKARLNYVRKNDRQAKEMSGLYKENRELFKPHIREGDHYIVGGRFQDLQDYDPEFQKRLDEKDKENQLRSDPKKFKEFRGDYGIEGIKYMEDGPIYSPPHYPREKVVDINRPPSRDAKIGNQLAGNPLAGKYNHPLRTKTPLVIDKRVNDLMYIPQRVDDRLAVQKPMEEPTDNRLAAQRRVDGEINNRLEALKRANEKLAVQIRVNDLLLGPQRENYHLIPQQREIDRFAPPQPGNIEMALHEQRMNAYKGFAPVQATRHKRQPSLAQYDLNGRRIKI